MQCRASARDSKIIITKITKKKRTFIIVITALFIYIYVYIYILFTISIRDNRFDNNVLDSAVAFFEKRNKCLVSARAI